MANLFNPAKTIKGCIFDIYSNTLIINYFRDQARYQGWSEEDINLVIDECQKGDYNYIIRVMSDHIVDM